jgi:hypothetical protein
MKMFSNMSVENLEPEVDFVGKGSRLFESGAYQMTVKLAYAEESSGGAVGVTFVFTDGSKELKQTFYVTTGKAKGQKPYYEKEGKQYPLPGLSMVNALCLMTTGEPLDKQETEEKVIPIWDNTQRKEVPTKKQVLMEVLGKDICLGILKITEPKKAKDSMGNWVDTDQMRTFNEVDKVFHPDNHKTVTEILSQAETAAYYDTWVQQNEGTVRDKTKKNNTPATSAPSTSPKKSLFS